MLAAIIVCSALCLLVSLDTGGPDAR